MAGKVKDLLERLFGKAELKETPPALRDRLEEVLSEEDAALRLTQRAAWAAELEALERQGEELVKAHQAKAIPLAREAERLEKAAAVARFKWSEEEAALRAQGFALSRRREVLQGELRKSPPRAIDAFLEKAEVEIQELSHAYRTSRIRTLDGVDRVIDSNADEVHDALLSIRALQVEAREGAVLTDEAAARHVAGLDAKLEAIRMTFRTGSQLVKPEDLREDDRGRLTYPDGRPVFDHTGQPRRSFGL